MMETASETVMGKKRLAKYLASKPEGEYSHLDKILKAYADGKVAQHLSQCSFYDTQITFQIVKNDNNLQIDGKYYNLAINISFLERGYEYAIYPLDKRIKQIEDRFETHTYAEGDTAESIITKICEKLQSHPELVIGPIPKNRRKLYALLSALFISLPVVVPGCAAIYGFAKDIPVYLNWWIIILLVISLLLGLHFYYKTRK